MGVALLMGTRDGRECIGGWWEASLCRLGQIVFPIKKKRRTLSSFSLFFVPVREIGFEGQLWEGDRRVCGCESKASFICILKRNQSCYFFPNLNPTLFKKLNVLTMPELKTAKACKQHNMRSCIFFLSFAFLSFISTSAAIIAIPYGSAVTQMIHIF